MLGCAGYPDKYPSYLQKIKRRPNAFQMVVIEPFGLFAPKERIKEIRVYEMDAKRTEIQRLWWEVVAMSPVLARGFDVQREFRGRHTNFEGIWLTLWGRAGRLVVWNSGN
jgi:hypothetical protein